MIWTAVRRLCGQPDGSPSGVADQSRARIAAAISPPRENRESIETELAKSTRPIYIRPFALPLRHMTILLLALRVNAESDVSVTLKGANTLARGSLFRQQWRFSTATNVRLPRNAAARGFYTPD